MQCKWAPIRAGVVCVNLTGYRLTSGGGVRSTYTEEEIDAVAAYCEAADQTYVLPARIVAGRRAIHLRVAPARNGQQAAINWAANYELTHGAVAQLARASAWHVEGRGFESHQLHSQVRASKTETVGADLFRTRFGQFLDRAAAGAEILITRRGRPFARLGPPQSPLPLDDDG